MKKTKMGYVGFNLEPELLELLNIEAGHREQKIRTTIREILWEYFNIYRKTHYLDASFWLKQVFSEKDLTDEQIEKAVKFVLKQDRIDEERLQLSQEELERIKFVIDIGMVD